MNQEQNEFFRFPLKTPRKLQYGLSAKFFMILRFAFTKIQVCTETTEMRLKISMTFRSM